MNLRQTLMSERTIMYDHDGHCDCCGKKSEFYGDDFTKYTYARPIEFDPDKGRKVEHGRGKICLECTNHMLKNRIDRIQGLKLRLENAMTLSNKEEE